VCDPEEERAAPFSWDALRAAEWGLPFDPDDPFVSPDRLRVPPLVRSDPPPRVVPVG
jgi:hypothetical protein